MSTMDEPGEQTQSGRSTAHRAPPRGRPSPRTVGLLLLGGLLLLASLAVVVTLARSYWPYRGC